MDRAADPNGAPLDPAALTTQLRRHISVDPDDPGACWVWTAKVDGDGYARAWRPRTGRWVSAHRWVFESLVGAIPDDLTLDHLCDVTRACVNPDHLVVVSAAENTRRAHLRRYLGVRFDRDGRAFLPDGGVFDDATNP